MCLGARHELFPCKSSIHTFNNHSFSLNLLTAITNSHLTFKLSLDFIKPSWMRFPDERSWHSVTKIYLVLKISEGELEALILSTEAPCHRLSSTRPVGNLPAAQLSQRQPHAAAALCKALHSRGVCLMLPAVQLYMLLRHPLNSLAPDPMPVWYLTQQSAGLLLLPCRPAHARVWELTGQQLPVRYCHSAKQCYQVPVICQYVISLLRKVQQACWNKPQFKSP